MCTIRLGVMGLIIWPTTQIRLPVSGVESGTWRAGLLQHKLHEFTGQSRQVLQPAGARRLQAMPRALGYLVGIHQQSGCLCGTSFLTDPGNSHWSICIRALQHISSVKNHQTRSRRFKCTALAWIIVHVLRECMISLKIRSWETVAVIV